MGRPHVLDAHNYGVLDESLSMHSTFYRRTLLGGLATIISGRAFGRPCTTQAHLLARACILIYLRGGPSQLETFDPKPKLSQCSSVPTSVGGLSFCEHLPKLAQRADRLTVIRSLMGTQRDHERANYLAHTSHEPQAGVQHPPLASVVSRDSGSSALPGYVAIGGRGHPVGVLEAAHGAFEVGDPLRPVRNLARPWRIDEARYMRRLELWRNRENQFHANHSHAELTGRRRLWEQAALMQNPAVSGAFDLNREPANIRDSYGRESRFGQGCLMARRLVEAGVPFVEIILSGWDTHTDNLSRTAKLCRTLDSGLPKLLDDLDERGLLERTLVLCMGEFGRTPWLNDKGGRDHYPNVSSAILAGAGIPGGTIIGTSSADGRSIVADPVTMPDLLRSVALKLGVDPDEEHVSPAGRPFNTIDGGLPLVQLGLRL